MAKKTSEKEKKTRLITKNKNLTPAWYVAKKVMRSQGISYEQIAEKLDISVTSVHDILNYTPNVMRIKQLSDAFDIPFFDFFDFSQEQTSTTNSALAGSASEKNTPQSKAILTCPHCGETLITSLSLFPK